MTLASHRAGGPHRTCVCKTSTVAVSGDFLIINLGARAPAHAGLLRLTIKRTKLHFLSVHRPRQRAYECRGLALLVPLRLLYFIHSDSADWGHHCRPAHTPLAALARRPGHILPFQTCAIIIKGKDKKPGARPGGVSKPTTQVRWLARKGQKGNAFFGGGKSLSQFIWS